MTICVRLDDGENLAAGPGPIPDLGEISLEHIEVNFGPASVRLSHGSIFRGRQAVATSIRTDGSRWTPLPAWYISAV